MPWTNFFRTHIKQAIWYVSYISLVLLSGDYSTVTLWKSENFENLYTRHSKVAVAWYSYVTWSPKSVICVFLTSNKVSPEYFSLPRRINEHQQICKNNLAKWRGVYLQWWINTPPFKKSALVWPWKLSEFYDRPFWRSVRNGGYKVSVWDLLVQVLALTRVIMARHLTLHIASLHSGVQTGKCELTGRADKKTEGSKTMKTGDKHWHDWPLRPVVGFKPS